MSHPVLHNWCVRLDGTGYMAPEQQRKYLEGDVYGHMDPRYVNGRRITTGYIAEAAGREVTTSSGSVYRLGRIDPTYRKWLRQCGIEYDAKCPIVVHSSEESSPAAQEP